MPRLRNEQSYASTPPWAFVACSRVNFTFTSITCISWRIWLTVRIIHRMNNIKRNPMFHIACLRLPECLSNPEQLLSLAIHHPFWAFIIPFERNAILVCSDQFMGVNLYQVVICRARRVALLLRPPNDAVRISQWDFLSLVTPHTLKSRFAITLLSLESICLPDVFYVFPTHHFRTTTQAVCFYKVVHITCA